MCVDNLTFNFICVIIPEVEVVVPNTGPPQQERVVCYNTLIYIHIQCELIEIGMIDTISTCNFASRFW